MGEVVIFWILCGIAGAAILSRHNKAGIGCLLGGLLGPIGLIIAWVIRSDATLDRAATQVQTSLTTAVPVDLRVERECPYCAERILAKARVCKHCGKDVDPLSTEAQ